MSAIHYKGPFKEHIQDHIELKKAVGYKYDTDAKNLKRFDNFTAERYPEAIVLSKEIVLDWCSKKTYETLANQCSRASVVRQFGKYWQKSLDRTHFDGFFLEPRVASLFRTHFDDFIF